MRSILGFSRIVILHLVVSLMWALRVCSNPLLHNCFKGEGTLGSQIFQFPIFPHSRYFLSWGVVVLPLVAYNFVESVEAVGSLVSTAIGVCIFFALCLHIQTRVHQSRIWIPRGHASISPILVMTLPQSSFHLL